MIKPVIPIASTTILLLFLSFLVSSIEWKAYVSRFQPIQTECIGVFPGSASLKNNEKPVLTASNNTLQNTPMGNNGELNSWVYLSTYGNELTKPQLINIFGYYNDSKVCVVVILNLGHMLSHIKGEEIGLVYTLKTNMNKSYHDHIRWEAYSHVILHFWVNSGDVRIKNQSFMSTLINEDKKRYYLNLRVPIIEDRVVYNVTVCAYASSYNSIAQIIHWVSYYQSLHASKIALYFGDESSHIISALSPFGDFVDIHSYYWKKGTQCRLHPQRNNQVAQINSCYLYYRLKSQYIISIDVDEYLFNYQSLIDLSTFVDRLYTDPRMEIQVVPNNYFLCNDSSINRDDLYRNNRLFSTCNQYKRMAWGHRVKMIIKRNYQGHLSVHGSISKASRIQLLNYVRTSVLDIAHYKRTLKISNLTQEVDWLLPYESHMEPFLHKASSSISQL